MTIDPSPSLSGAPYVVRTTRRRGRMSDAKRTALAELLPRWVVDAPLTPTELDDAFGRSAPRLLDVGVGTGEATRAWAAGHPDHDVVAVELHRPGLARLLQELEADGPSNVRVLEADATRVVTHLVELRDHGTAPSFQAVRVLFPDPWPKKRHRPRRLVDEVFTGDVADLLVEGGWLHVATDWDDYAVQVHAALRSDTRWELEVDHAVPAGGPLVESSARPDRPVTTYERRGLEAGRRITDLVARRRAR